MADVTAQAAILDQYKYVVDAIKQLEERKNALREMLIEALAGESDGLIDGTTAYTYRTSVSRRLDQKALKKALPDVAAKYMVESSSTRFLLAGDDNQEQ